uniref:Putative phytoene synthase CrtB-like n=1 Tax=mine drainage metagenome TaxID=410659 RepID=E6PYZ3_9ZZZZ
MIVQSAPETAETAKASSTELLTAYRICRAIAKREAKNFYYAFVALPADRRDAICAVYAFMRRADDLADDESFTREQRRCQLNSWLDEWHKARSGAATDDLVFIAVRDAASRFSIPYSLLDELVAGTTMDLDETAASRAGLPDTYADFNELYRYCYLVASVVGLVCIRIFGYSDPRAEKLAEHTGIAFQLTNILRDIAEDAERNRIYLPLTDLAQHNVTILQIRHRSGQGITAAERALFQSIGARAEEYYRAARELLPLIDPASRPALWVLVTIYHRLLRRVQSADYDVISERISVPRWQKLAILFCGLTWMTATRLRLRIFSK